MNTTENPSLTPIKDDTPDGNGGMDEAKGGFNLRRLMGLVSDCEDQPAWRRRADVASAYIDGKQFSPEQQAAAIAEGMGEVRPTNLIGRVIRSVCGQEAKARTDIKVESDEDEEAEVSDVLNVKMKEAQRECYADQAVSQAYFWQVGPGKGWVEVARNADPLDYPYRVQEVHRSELWWDWKSKDVLHRDARWVARKRWQDLDELEAAMPQHRALLRQVSNGWGGFLFDNSIDERSPLAQSYRDHDTWSQYNRRIEWFDTARKRVKMYEVWYKVPAMGIVLHFGPTRRILFNPANQAHIDAVSTGRVKITKEKTRQIRMALFAGPHRLADIPTARRNYPYIPFTAYTDDEDLSPYGLVEGMISPQDEYNARRLRINWMLRARQILMDSDALDTNANTLTEIAARIMRPDLTVVLNPNRKFQDAFRVSSDQSLQAEQVTVMQDAKQLLQDVPGIYGSQLGQAASGVTSGIANSLLIEQGAVSMGDLNDNYRHSRRMVYENLMDLIIEDHSAPGMQVRIGRGSTRRVVVLNQWDGEQGVMVNSVSDAAVRVGLGEVPATAAYRLQQMQSSAAIIQALVQVNPQAAAVMVPGFIESTDAPDRMERADDVRRMLGIPTAGDRQAQEQNQQAQAQQQAKQAQMQEAAGQLALETAAAKAEHIKSQTELNNAKTVEIGHNMGTDGVSTAATAAAATAPQPADPQAERQRMINEALAEAAQA